MNDEDLRDFKAGRQALGGGQQAQQDGGGDPLRPGWWLPEAAGGMLGFGEGALKEAGGLADRLAFPTVPQSLGGSGKPDSPDALRRWADSDDPNHPIAETAGRWGADVAPMFAMPEFAEGAVMRATPQVYSALASRVGPKMAKTMLDRGLPWATGAARVAEGTGQGAIGGATVGGGDEGQNIGTGAEFGGGSALTHMAWNALPARLRHALMAAGGITALGMAEGHRYMPWPVAHAVGYGIVPTLAGLAASIAKPGVAGQLGARGLNAVDNSGSSTGTPKKLEFEDGE